MAIILAAMAGLVQGLTEFLPVSSSAHLLLFHEMFDFNVANDLFFDVTMHIATLLALLFVFRKDIKELVEGIFGFIFHPNLQESEKQKVSLLFVVGSLPVLFVGYFLGDFIETKLRTPLTAIVMLAVVGLLFFIVEKISTRKKEIKSISVLDAMAIGTAQCLALAPGVSRSGITVSAGLLCGLKRHQASRFSFLISIPAVFGAAVKASLGLESWLAVDWAVISAGFFAALVSGVAAIRFFLSFVERHSLRVFGWYRLALSFVAALWLILSK